MRSRRGAARSVAAPFPARPWPPLAAARVAGPRPLPRAGASPPALAPVAPGARRAVCAQGFLFAASGRPCAPLCASPLCSAPSLARAGLRGAVGRPRAPAPWAARSLGRGRRCPPAPPPCGGSLAPAPPGGLLLARLAPRLLVPPSPPPGFGAGAAAAAAAARLRLSVSLPGACFRVSRRVCAAAALRACCSEEGEMIDNAQTRYAAPPYYLHKRFFRVN